MKLLIYILAILSLSFQVFSAEISGTVVNENDEALVGATIRVEGTNIGSFTNKKGYFSIENLKNQKYSLLFSMVGYKSKTKKIDLSKLDSSYVKIRLSENHLQTGEVVVSANKRVQAVQDIPISVSVIKSEDIEIRRMNNLEYALEYVPGIQVTRDNVSIRGSSGFSYGVGSRVALMIDGFPLLAADNGDIKMDALPLFNLERIEVVKGAGSALYGTSAIGGVINIITQNIPDEFTTKFRAYSGFYTPLNYDQWDPGGEPRLDNGFDFSASNKFGDLSVLLNLGIVQEDSYRVYDSKEVYNSFLKMKYQLNDKTDITLNGNLSISNNDDWAFWQSASEPFEPAETVDFDNRIDSDKYSLFAGLDHIFNSNFFMTLKSGVYFTTYSNRFDKDNEEYRASDAVAYTFLPQFNNKLGDEWLLTYGLDLRLNQVESIVYGDQTQGIYAAYTQAEYSPFESLNFTGGLRFDLESTEGADESYQLSPKFGVTYQINEEFTLRSSAGAGFRAPQIAERFAQISFQGLFVLPNPELVPERSISTEIGIAYNNQSEELPLYIDLAIFQNNMEEMIEPGLGETITGEVTFNNISSARIRGLELNLKTFLFGKIGLELSGTALDPMNLETSNILPFRSKFLSQNRFILPFSNFRFELDYKFFAKMATIDERLQKFGIVNDARFRNNAHIFDARLNYNMEKIFGKEISATLNVFNLFNYYYTQMVGNMGPTRQISLMIQGNFK